MVPQNHDKSIDIEIDKSQGINLGEEQYIYQYFGEPAHSIIQSYAYSFLSFIDDKTKNFVGREFVLNAIDKFIEENKSGYFLIKAKPGVGKSALLAHLVKKRGYPHHFNIASQNIRRPEQFLRNSCAQIIARYDLEISTFPPNAFADSGFLLHLLELASSDTLNHPVVLLIDALDESSSDTRYLENNPLYLPNALPSGAFIIATTRQNPRPTSEISINASTIQSLYLEADSKSNLQDISNYIRKFVVENKEIRERILKWKVTKNFFVKQLAEKSEGNFIYLRYVLPAISRGEFVEGGIEVIPDGLRAYYLSHWRRMKSINTLSFEEHVEPIIAILASAPSPVSPTLLSKWTGIAMNRIESTIAQWGEFLNEDLDEEGERLYSIYHTSFKDFLSEIINLSFYRDKIANHYLNQIPNC